MLFNRRLKQVADAALRQAGFDLIPHWRLSARPLARKIARLLSRFDIDAIIDIGANEGQYHDFIRQQVGFAGNIVSFEPDPDLASVLRKRAAIEDPNWQIHEFALGASNGRATFNKMEDTQFNSFHLPSAAQLPQFEHKSKIVRSFDVEMRRLDDIATSMGSLHRTYVKIDTQGYDLEVLKGGVVALTAVPALQAEVSFRPIYADSPDFLESAAAFDAAGFAIADMFLISADPDERAIEFDCLMVRKPSTEVSAPQPAIT